MTMQTIQPEEFQLDMETAIRVEGIQNWIQDLLKIQEVPVNGFPETMLRMVDAKTGAVFLIARIQ